MKVFHFLGRGAGHEADDKGCEDRLYFTQVHEKKHIYAISDGCSSSQYAAEAAQCNVDVIKKIFSQLDINDLNRASLIKLYPCLKNELTKLKGIKNYFQLIFEYEMECLARRLGVKNAQKNDFCATLLFVVVEEEYTLLGHCGDGNIIFYDNNGKVVARSEATNDKDAYHTYFTLSLDFSQHFLLGKIPTNSYDSFMLFSDGLQTMFRLEYDNSILKGCTEIVLRPILNKEVTDNYQLAQKLYQSMYAYHYCFDDWSLIVACKEQKDSEIMKPVSLRNMFRQGIDVDNIQYVDTEPIKNKNLEKELMKRELKKEGNVNDLCEKLKSKLSHMIQRCAIKKK